MEHSHQIPLACLYDPNDSLIQSLIKSVFCLAGVVSLFILCFVAVKPVVVHTLDQLTLAIRERDVHRRDKSNTEEKSPNEKNLHGVLSKRSNSQM